MERNDLPPMARGFDFGCEQSARRHVALRLWGGEAPNRCPHCGARRIWHNRRLAAPYRCAYCRKRFSIRTGTIMADSPLGVRQWLLAINILTTNRREPSPRLLARMLGVSAPTAGFLARRIRAHAGEAKALLGAANDAATINRNINAAHPLDGGRRDFLLAVKQENQSGHVGARIRTAAAAASVC